MGWNTIATEALGISIAQKTTTTGAVTGFFGFITSENLLGLIGVLLAAIGLAFNVYFQVKRDRRESVESKARLAALKERSQP
jgi:hypothetical protein